MERSYQWKQLMEAPVFSLSIHKRSGIKRFKYILRSMLVMKHLKVTFCLSFNIHNLHELAILVPQEVKESTNACRCRFVSSLL